MNIAEFRRLVEMELLDQGLVKKKVAGFQNAVFAAEPGETIRFFSPHALRRPWGCQLQGSFGVEVPALRSWAQEQGFPSPDLWLTYYMTNELQFLSPVPVIGQVDLPRFRVFVKTICSRVLTLPSSVAELVSASNDTQWHLSLLCASNPGFWKVFSKWAEDTDVLAASVMAGSSSGTDALQILTADEMRQVRQRAHARFIEELPPEAHGYPGVGITYAELAEPPPPPRKP